MPDWQQRPHRPWLQLKLPSFATPPSLPPHLILFPRFSLSLPSGPVPACAFGCLVGRGVLCNLLDNFESSLSEQFSGMTRKIGPSDFSANSWPAIDRYCRHRRRRNSVGNSVDHVPDDKAICQMPARGIKTPRWIDRTGRDRTRHRESVAEITRGSPRDFALVRFDEAFSASSSQSSPKFALPRLCRHDPILGAKLR